MEWGDSTDGSQYYQYGQQLHFRTENDQLIRDQHSFSAPKRKRTVGFSVEEPHAPSSSADSRCLAHPNPTRGHLFADGNPNGERSPRRNWERLGEREINRRIFAKRSAGTYAPEGKSDTFSKGSRASSANRKVRQSSRGNREGSRWKISASGLKTSTEAPSILDRHVERFLYWSESETSSSDTQRDKGDPKYGNLDPEFSPNSFPGRGREHSEASGSDERLRDPVDFERCLDNPLFRSRGGTASSTTSSEVLSRLRHYSSHNLSASLSMSSSDSSPGGKDVPKLSDFKTELRYLAQRLGSSLGEKTAEPLPPVADEQKECVQAGTGDDLLLECRDHLFDLVKRISVEADKIAEERRRLVSMKHELADTWRIGWKLAGEVEATKSSVTDSQENIMPTRASTVVAEKGQIPKAVKSTSTRNNDAMMEARGDIKQEVQGPPPRVQLIPRAERTISNSDIGMLCGKSESLKGIALQNWGKIADRLNDRRKQRDANSAPKSVIDALQWWGASNTQQAEDANKKMESEMSTLSVSAEILNESSSAHSRAQEAMDIADTGTQNEKTPPHTTPDQGRTISDSGLTSNNLQVPETSSNQTQPSVPSEISTQADEVPPKMVVKRPQPLNMALIERGRATGRKNRARDMEQLSNRLPANPAIQPQTEEPEIERGSPLQSDQPSQNNEPSIPADSDVEYAKPKPSQGKVARFASIPKAQNVNPQRKAKIPVAKKPSKAIIERARARQQERKKEGEVQAIPKAGKRQSIVNPPVGSTSSKPQATRMPPDETNTAHQSQPTESTPPDESGTQVPVAAVTPPNANPAILRKRSAPLFLPAEGDNALAGKDAQRKQEERMSQGEVAPAGPRRQLMEPKGSSNRVSSGGQHDEGNPNGVSKSQVAPETKAQKDQPHRDGGKDQPPEVQLKPKKDSVEAADTKGVRRMGSKRTYTAKKLLTDLVSGPQIQDPDEEGAAQTVKKSLVRILSSRSLKRIAETSMPSTGDGGLTVESTGGQEKGIRKAGSLRRQEEAPAPVTEVQRNAPQTWTENASGDEETENVEFARDRFNYSQTEWEEAGNGDGQENTGMQNVTKNVRKQRTMDRKRNRKPQASSKGSHRQESPVAGSVAKRGDAARVTKHVHLQEPASHDTNGRRRMSSMDIRPKTDANNLKTFRSLGNLKRSATFGKLLKRSTDASTQSLDERYEKYIQVMSSESGKMDFTLERHPSNEGERERRRSIFKTFLGLFPARSRDFDRQTSV